MKEFIEQIKGISDILNIGRLIFYTFAGALTTAPLYMFLHLLRHLDHVQPSLLAQVGSDLPPATLYNSPAGLLLWSSLVTGFLIATAGFPFLAEGLGASIKQELDREPVLTTSYPYNYPFLRGSTTADYADSLISEYYRYVEIATYIPLGAIAGLAILGLYVVVFFLSDYGRGGAAGLSAAHLSIVAILGLLVLTRYYLWPEIWAKRVLAPTIRTYLRAKRDLVAGLEAKPGKRDAK